MTPLLPRYRIIPASTCALLAASLMAGCAGAGRRPGNGGSAPSLTSEERSQRPFANPNAPFVLIDRVHHKPQTAAAAEEAAGVPACAASGLAMSEASSETADSTRTIRIAFVNRGDAACRLTGYPQVSFEGSDGSPISGVTVQPVYALPQEAAPQPGTAAAEQPAVLSPGARASFELQWTAGENCPRVGRLVVVPPGCEQPLTLNRPLAPCGGTVLITPIKPSRSQS